MPPVRQEEQLRTLVDALIEGVTGLFMERSEIAFSRPPEVVLQDIVEYKGRMRVFGLEKFNTPIYVSTVNYYLNEKDMAGARAHGALAVFVEQEYIADLLKLLRYPEIDDTEEDAMLDACGTLANIIAGRFKTEMMKLGLIKLEMSAFSNYRNSAPNGVAFNFKQRKKYEVSFFIKDKKRVILELTMGPVPPQS